MANTVLAVEEARGVAMSEKFAYGEVVPIPTMPALDTMKSVNVVEPTTNDGAPNARPVGFTESSPHGDDVACPDSPVLVNVRMGDEVANVVGEDVPT